MTYVDLRPDDVREVRVQLKDGTWITGDLEAYHRRSSDGAWEGYRLVHRGPDPTGTVRSRHLLVLV